MDSGGGFTKDAMKKALIHEKLANIKEYIHVNCTEYNNQTAYCNAAEKVYGSWNKNLQNTTQFNIRPYHSERMKRQGKN